MMTSLHRRTPLGLKRVCQGATLRGGAVCGSVQQHSTTNQVAWGAVARPRRSSTKASAFLPDASHLSDLTNHLANAHLLTVADIATVSTAAQGAVQDAAGAAPAAAGAGPFDSLARLMEGALTMIDGGLEKLSVPYSYGFSIIILTLLVKVATFPLTQKQVQSTLAVQALAPSVKDLQAKHAGDPERLQLETARLYKEANVNPLSGCLPTLATIPVFIGLYRALTLAASDGLLNEGFFFVPSLGGPSTMEQQLNGQGMSWLLPFVDGAPPLGWLTTVKYIALPVLLVASQYASMSISQPPNSDDPSVKQTQAILKYLPIMIGYFALNVPAGLTIYWLTNNVLTTAQQVYLKKVTKIELPKVTGTIVNPVVDVKASAVAGSAETSAGARRSRKGETFRARQATESTGTVAKNARGKKKGKKFAERKSVESSGAPSSASAGNGSANTDLSPVAAQAQARVQAAANAVTGEVVMDAPAAVPKPSKDSDGPVVVAEVTEAKQGGHSDRKEEASGNNKA